MPEQTTNESDVLSRFFEPESVAVIGSFKEGFFGGHVIVKSLLNAGYGGRVHPINPAYGEVLGLKAHAAIGEVEDRVDLAMIMVNARTVSSVLEECAGKGVRAAIVISDGFAERDREGARLQQEMVSLANRRGIRIIGPNTAGIANTVNGFNPCPYEAGYYRLKQGPVTVASQTGMTNPQAFPYPSLGYGTSKICDFGNKCDLDESDLLEYLETDTQTGVISMYLESIRDGRRFLCAARRVASRKPVMILKAGRTPRGAGASASHTGSLAVDDRIFEAACRQTGILRLDGWNELFEIPKIFATQPLPAGSRLGVVSYTGGMGVLAMDQCAGHGLEVTKLTPETCVRLNGLFQGLGKMPVDIGPMAPAVDDFFSLYPKILQQVLSDDNVDMLFNILWADPAGMGTDVYPDAYERFLRDKGVPLATWIYGPDPGAIGDLTQRLEDLGYPVFSSPELCVKALGMAARFSEIRRRGGGGPPGSLRGGEQSHEHG